MMSKTVTFVYEDGTKKVFLLNTIIKGLRDSSGKRPIKAIFNFSRECALDEVEKNNVYCAVIPALNPLKNEVIYE